MVNGTLHFNDKTRLTKTKSSINIMDANVLLSANI